MATYQQNMYTGAAEGYVQYAIAPEFGAPIAPGETVTISGTAYCRDAATGSISVNLQNGSGGQRMIFANCSIAKRRAGWFSITFQMPEFSGISDRTAKLPITFTLWEGPNGTGGGSGTFAVSGQEITYLAHRFDPMVLEMDFGRCDAAGNWDNTEGQYLRCGALRISKNAKASLSELTTAKITCADESGAVVKTVDLDPAKYLTPAFSEAGYSEAAPGIFAGFATQLGMNYTLTLTLADAYDRTAATARVVRCFARLHLSGAKNGGVAVGMFSTATDKAPKFEVADTHESFFYGGISGVTNYVEGEVATGGRWMDGKPIYRYVHTYQVAMPCNPWTSIATLPFTIETLISDETLIDESATRGSGGTNPVAYPDSASFNSAVQFWGNTIMSYFGTGWKSYPGRVMYIHVNIEYTKASASDPPIEGPSMALLEAPPDKAIARTDYIAMMAGIEIPDDVETTVGPGAQSDPNGMEGPGIDGEPAPSAHYDAIARYYKYDCWNEQMVKNAGGRWITEDEARKILDDEQTEGK